MRNFRFSSPRWFGRLNAVIRHIAMNSHLDVDYKAENPYLDYRMEVLEVATDIEKDVISRLEAKWTSANMICNNTKAGRNYAHNSNLPTGSFTILLLLQTLFRHKTLSATCHLRTQ